MILIYDQYGRVISSQQLLSGGWAQVNRSYDALGRLEEITAPYYSGDPVYVSTYGYDALGRVTRLATPSPSTAPGAASAVTTVSYTGLTTTATQQSNGATTVSAYDPLDEIASVQDADGNTSAYAWGPFGELTQVSGPDSVITTLSYDGLGRLTGESVPGNTNLTRGWDYSEQGNAAGQLYKETQGSAFTRLFSYDPDGNLTQDDESLNGAALWFNYAWDSLGRLTSISYPNTTAAARLKLAYAWDANGALASVTDANSGTVYWQENPDAPVEMQNAWGATQAWTLGSGTAVERSYEGATDALTSVKAGPALVNLSYGYDALGNVTHTNDAVEGVSRTLSYDALNRYKGVTITNPNAPNGFTRGTYYNGGGNLTSRTLVGSYTYGENAAPPHAVTTITQQGNLNHYGYDANGRMTSGAGYASVSWNPYNEPTELETGASGTPPSVWLGYDPDGNLLTKTVYGNAQWRYFGKLFVETGSSYRERIMANGEVVAVMNVNSAGFPSVNYFIHDNLGSTATVLDASGALEGRYAWDVWGDNVVGHCGVECAGQQLDNQSLSLWITAAPIGISSYGGPGAGSYSAQSTSTNTNKKAQQKQQQCSAAKEAAAQLGKDLEAVERLSAALAIASGIGSGISGAGEGLSFGGDTPVTISFGSAAVFFTGASFTAGALAAGFRSFANGNLTGLQDFDVTHLEGIAATLMASRIPGVSAFADTIGELAEQASALTATAQEACQ